MTRTWLLVVGQCLWLGSATLRAAEAPAADANLDWVAHAVTEKGAAGGGQVTIPPGLHLTHPFMLPAGVTLHLERGAVLRGVAVGKKNVPLIRAKGVANIAITGEGVIEGQETLPLRSLKPPVPDDFRAVAHWYYDWQPKVPRNLNIINFESCTNVTVQGVTLRNAGSWTVRFNGCRDVVVRGVTIRNPYEAPCLDGIDPCDSENVLIEKCDIETSDDAVCIKSTRLRPSRNITIRDCRLRTICNAIKLGTSSVGTVENVQIERCVVDGMATASIYRCISGVALESVDGGHVRNIRVSDLTIHNARNALFLRLGLRQNAHNSEHEVQKPSQPGCLEDITFERIRADGIRIACPFAGIPGHRIRHVALNDVQIRFEGGGAPDPQRVDLPIRAGTYPESLMWGELPAWGFYLRHIEDLQLRDCVLECAQFDKRPAWFIEDAANLQTGNTVIRGASGETLKFTPSGGK